VGDVLGWEGVICGEEEDVGAGEESDKGVGVMLTND